MSDIGLRIREIRNDNSLTQTEFGKKLSVSRDVIGNFEYRRVEPKELFIKHLCEVFSVNEHWLKNGKGARYIKSNTEIELAKALASIKKSDNKTLQEMTTKLSKLSDEHLDLLSKLIDAIEKK